MKRLTLTITAVFLIMASLHAAGNPVKGIPAKKASIDKQIQKTETQAPEQRLRASITFTDACGNELTVTGTCESCTDISQWNTAFNNWWAQNSTGGCINPGWLE